MTQEVLKYEKPDSAELNRQASAVLAFANGLLIDSPEMNQIAGEELQAIKGQINALDTKRKTITQPMDVAKAAVMNLFREPIEVRQTAERTIKSKMLAWATEQERIAKEQRDAAEKAAREERERLEREAVAETKRAEEAAAELLNGENGPASEEVVQQAEQIIQAAQETSHALRSTAAVVTAPVVTQMPSRASGTAVKELWKASVEDKAAFIQHVAANPELLGLLDINQTALNKMASALKSSLNFPGVRAYSERSLSSRAA